MVLGFSDFAPIPPNKLKFSFYMESLQITNTTSLQIRSTLHLSSAFNFFRTLHLASHQSQIVVCEPALMTMVFPIVPWKLWLTDREIRDFRRSRLVNITRPSEVEGGWELSQANRRPWLWFIDGLQACNPIPATMNQCEFTPHPSSCKHHGEYPRLHVRRISRCKHCKSPFELQMLSQFGEILTHRVNF